MGDKQRQVKIHWDLPQCKHRNAAHEQLEFKYNSRFNSKISTIKKKMIAYDKHFGLKQSNEMLGVSKPTILLDSSNLLLAPFQILLLLSNPVLKSRCSLVEMQVSC